MVVYVEYLLISNFIIDYLLLKSTLLTSNQKISKRRLVLCSLFSSLFSLIYPLLSSVKIIEITVKLAFGLLIVLLSCKFKSIKSYYVNCVLFFFYTFLTGGGTYALFNLFEINLQSELVGVLVTIPVYLIAKGGVSVVRYVYKRKEVINFTYQVEITVGDKIQRAVGFLDTGNSVFYDNSPVVFCSKKIALSLIDFSKKNNLKKISVTTVNGKRQKLCIQNVTLKIYNQKIANIYNNVTLCFISDGLEEDYDLLLHPALLKENYENQFDKSYKRVS